MFTRLEFHDFRGFAHLDLPGLQRVNLICGQNNSGKTSLLEGIDGLCNPSSFYSTSDLTSLRADSTATPEQRSVWLRRDAAVGSVTVSGVDSSGQSRAIFLGVGTSQLPAGAVALGNLGPVTLGMPQGQKAVSCSRVPAYHSESARMLDLFDRAVSRRGGEERMEELLRAVDSRVRKVRIRVVGTATPILEVDLGLSQRIPLSQTGQGMVRLVTIFSLLLGEAPKVCVIDEIENGLHHTLLPQIWAGIAAAARELDVQVFATTHSRECIEAAHEVFEKEPSYDFSVIQLFRSDADRDLPTQGRVLDRRLVSAAVAGSVDLR